MIPPCHTSMETTTRSSCFAVMEGPFHVLFHLTSRPTSCERLGMTDLQCQKFSYCGFKMQILGKILITVQCINYGVSSGTFHIKENVVVDLAKHLDTECVASAKMAARLKGNMSPASSTEMWREESGSNNGTKLEMVQWLQIGALKVTRDSFLTE